MQRSIVVLLLFYSSFLLSCNKVDTQPEIPDSPGVYICNEGNFNFGNADISFYHPEKKEVRNGLFYIANQHALGDVAQAFFIRDSVGFIVVNNSQKVEVVSVPSMKKIRTISITASSPRYFYPLNDSIAYLTELYSAKIYVLNYLRGAVIKEITSVSPWTEHIIPFGDDVLVEERNLDAAPKSTAGFVRINTTTHSVKQRYTFNGSNINGILKDKYHRVWLLLAEDSASMTRPSLICLNSDMSIHRTLLFPSGHLPTLLRINDTGDELYYVDRDVFRLSINAVNLPDTPLILQNNRNIYSMETDPYSGDIYLSDALDYVQPSRISRYNNKGQLLDAFYAGIIAGNFTFRKE